MPSTGERPPVEGKMPKCRNQLLGKCFSPKGEYLPIGMLHLRMAWRKVVFVFLMNVYSRYLHWKKFRHVRVQLCTLYGRHVQVCFQIFSICYETFSISLMQICALKLCICYAAFRRPGPEQETPPPPPTRTKKAKRICAIERRTTVTSNSSSPRSLP